MEPLDLPDTYRHLENLVENYITEEEESELLAFLENEEFAVEGSRGVCQYGEYYNYMGSKAKPKPLPDPIRELLGRLNSEHSKSHTDATHHYELNSCLVNRYENNESVLPEHADNEGAIDPKSSIFTLSLGASRELKFRNLQNNDVNKVMCKSRSLYWMTRHSQDFYKHSMDKPEGTEHDGVRYSLTFRAIHWSNFNSTAFVGDSNFGSIKIGRGKGYTGESTPGLRFWAPTIDSLNPLAYTSYRNVVIMVGTNDLKLDSVQSHDNIKDLYSKYKTKITLIRKYNKNCKIFVCPVLPSKSHKINRKVVEFNQYLFNDLCLSDLKVNLVEGFLNFLDVRRNLLKDEFAKGDELHINGRGTSVLVKFIKNAIFQAKQQQKKQSKHRLYSEASRGGSSNPA